MGPPSGRPSVGGSSNIRRDDLLESQYARRVQREPEASLFGPGLVSLAELVAVPDLRLSCRFGQDRLNVAVRWAHTTELLDPALYLRGGELVCTVGTSLSDDAACAKFAHAVKHAGGSGICFGLGDVYDEVPTGLVRACESQELPLLLAPLGMPFIAISEYLAQQRVAAESAASERGGQLLTELLAGVRRHAAPADLLALAAAGLGGRLTLSDGNKVLLACGPATTTDEGYTTALEEAAPDGTVLGWSGSGPPPAVTLLATLTQVLEVARHERDVEEELQRERLGQLLSLVGERLADPAALAPMLAAAGLGQGPLVFSVWPSGAARVLAARALAAVVVLGETPVAAVAVTGSAEPVRDAASTLGLACGLSRPVTLADSARGLGEAGAAFDLARRSGGCVGPEGLTSLEGLLEQQPPDRLRPFIDQLLLPLIASDTRRGTAHVRTLRTYLSHDGSLTETARAEYLHVNTVRHRLERIRDLTGRDPVQFTDRVALAIALWAQDHMDQAAAFASERNALS